MRVLYPILVRRGLKKVREPVGSVFFVIDRSGQVVALQHLLVLQVRALLYSATGKSGARHFARSRLFCCDIIVTTIFLQGVPTHLKGKRDKRKSLSSSHILFFYGLATFNYSVRTVPQAVQDRYQKAIEIVVIEQTTDCSAVAAFLVIMVNCLGDYYGHYINRHSHCQAISHCVSTTTTAAGSLEGYKKGPTEIPGEKKTAS